MKNNEKEINKNVLSESKAVYSEGRIKIFSSFEEANEDDAKAKAKLSPQQHLRNVTERIKVMYAEELKQPMDKTLKFRNA